MSTSAVEASPAVLIRPYRPGDEVAINTGFNEVFGLARSLEEWRWKFGGQGEFGRLLVAERDGEILAHFGTLLASLWWRGRELVVAQTVDCYAKRRQGIVQSRLFEQLFWAFREHFGGEVDALFGFPGARHMKLGHLRLGYAPALPVVVWRRSVRPGSLRAPRPATVNDSDLDRLWAHSRHRFGAAFRRDAAASKRRFSGRPGVEYQRVTARRWWTRLEALATTRALGSRLLVADLLWDGTRVEALERLDSQLDPLARAAGCGELETWLSGDSEAAAVLGALGWIAAPHEQQLGATAVSFRDDVDAVALLNALYVTMADADLV